MAQPPAYKEWSSGVDDVGRRLDRVARRLLKDLPLTAIYGALRRGRILVNGAKAAPDYRLAAGDRIGLDPRLARSAESPAPSQEDENLDSLGGLLLLATRDLLFINKPAGELVHGAGSIEERVREALRGPAAQSLSFSPGPLHRLDRNTSGLVVYPRSARGARVFSELVRGRAIRKRYLALLEGRLEAPEAWHDNLRRDSVRRLSSVVAAPEGRRALSRALPLLWRRGATLALVEIETGLTHQIRVQAASRAHPLVGDAKYGGSHSPEGYLLHALSLEFSSPPLPDLPEFVVAPLPETARARLARLFPGADLDMLIQQASRA